MIAEIGLHEAAARRWDVVIAGTSFAAMFFALGLKPGLSVLFVEKGVIESHADQIAGNSSPPERIAMDNRSGQPKTWIANSRFGGNSNCWWGQTPRLHPSDFRLYSDHGQAMDWPLSYTDVEPFYAEAEAMMEISGGGDAAMFPRSRPYPFPPHQGSRTDLVLWEKRPDIWFPSPSARSNGGARATCCGNGVCLLCPIEAKFTILNGIDNFNHPGMALLTGAEVRRVETAGGRADGVELRMANGDPGRIGADAVALGANAIFNAAILLRSGLTAPALGRYLNEQASVTLDIDIDAPNYFGGSLITGLCYGFHHGPHRATAGAVLIENHNALAALRHERGRWTDRMRLRLIAEDLPQAENRVTLDAGGAPQVTWIGHSAYAQAGLDRAEAAIAEVLPFRVEGIAARVVPETEAHIQGTHRMGSDPATSVTDAALRCHEVPGLLALGAGAFPSCPPANPTLTLSALSLRAGRLM